MNITKRLKSRIISHIDEGKYSLYLSNNNKYVYILIKSAVVLFLIGLLTGVYVSLVATGQINADLNYSLAAHLNGVIGALILIALAVTIRMIRYRPPLKMALILMFIVSNYANWLITLTKSILQVSGVGLIPFSPLNNLVHLSLMIFVVIPSIVGSILWVLGIRKKNV